MGEFPGFMKKNENAIHPDDQSQGVESFVFDGVDGMQMTYWSAKENGMFREHVHDHDEYLVVIEGSYTIVVGYKETVLGPGMEYFIPGGRSHRGRYAKGTRTIHCFGNKRARRRSPAIRYQCPVLAVGDVNRSRDFYSNLLGQKVREDHGEMVAFANRFAIMDRSHLQKLMGSAEDVELYFESEEIEKKRDLMRELGASFLHDIVVQPWGQKVFRIRDPDGYIVEIGERMNSK